jgi:hypothetical protein
MSAVKEESTRKQSLFEIEAEIVEIANAFDHLSDSGEDQPIKDAIERYFGTCLDKRDQKIDSYLSFKEQLEARAKYRKEKAKGLTDLAKTDERIAADLETRLYAFFKTVGIEKLETGLHKLWIQKSGARSVEIDPTAECDERTSPRFVRVKYEWNKEAIKLALEQGETLSFATLAEPKEGLRYK